MHYFCLKNSFQFSFLLGKWGAYENQVQHPRYTKVKINKNKKRKGT